LGYLLKFFFLLQFWETISYFEKKKKRFFYKFYSMNI